MKLLRSIALTIALIFVFVGVQAQCDAPTTSHSNIYSTQITLSWDPIPAAIEYMLIASIQGIATIDTFYFPATDSFSHFSGLKKATTYQWAVKSICDTMGNESPLSSILTFTTLAADSCAPPYDLLITSLSNNSAELWWNEVPTASGYIVNGNGSFVASVVSNTYSWSGLSDGTEYIWNVQAICLADTSMPLVLDTSVVSNPDTFITLSCPLPGTIFSSEVGADSFRISWFEVDNASAYKLSYGITGLPPTIVMVNDTTFVASALASNTTYYYILSVTCNEGGSDFFSISSDSMFVTTNMATTSCAQPDPIFVTNITLETAKLNWTGVPGAISYKVSGKQSGTSTYLDLTFNSTFTSFDATGLSQGVTYVWKIQANCTADTSMYTDHDTFTTLICPTPTNLIDSFITANSAWLGWDKVDEAVNYRLFGKEATSSQIVQYVLPPDTVLFVNSLSSGSTYFWAVQSICDLGTNFSSFLSNISNFTTLNPSEKAFTRSNNVNIWPNPVSDRFYVDVQYPESTIKILTIDGKLIVDQNINSRAEFDVSEWNIGMYLIQVTSGSETSVRKLVIE